MQLRHLTVLSELIEHSRNPASEARASTAPGGLGFKVVTDVQKKPGNRSTRRVPEIAETEGSKPLRTWTRTQAGFSATHGD